VLIGVTGLLAAGVLLVFAGAADGVEEGAAVGADAVVATSDITDS
jgi:hypothetical protein